MNDGKTLLRRLRKLAPEKRRDALFAAGERAAREIDGGWPVWAHEGQLPPHDAWTVWVMLAGRGFGKTRAGAEWVSARARENGQAKIALVAATPDEARRVMIEGRSGLFAVARDGEERRGMRWEPSLKRLTFASGAEAFVYSGADGESLRGPEHHFAWCDELAKWRQAEAAWDNLMLGLRAGTRPQVVVTTTPRAVPALKRVLAMDDVVLTGGASWRNPHLPKAFIETVERIHAGTRLERQELLGQLIEDVEGALFSRELLERCRVPAILPGTGRGTMRSMVEGAHCHAWSPLHHAASRRGPPSSALRCSDVPRTSCASRPRAGEDLRRIVIGVDPPVTADGDECGIVACGLDSDGTAYVLGDHSVGGLSPEQWASKVAMAAETWGADRIIAEGNQGGDMVDAVLRGAGVKLLVRRVHATVNKARRAEPIVAFFERGEVKLAGVFPELEDQLAGLVIGGDYQGSGQGSHRSSISMGSRSPDRADACVWALTELLLKAPAAEPRVRVL